MQKSCVPASVKTLQFRRSEHDNAAIRPLNDCLIFAAPMRHTTKVANALFDKSLLKLIQINVASPTTPLFRSALNFEIKNSEREANDFGIFTAD